MGEDTNNIPQKNNASSWDISGMQSPQSSMLEPHSHSAAKHIVLAMVIVAVFALIIGLYMSNGLALRHGTTSVTSTTGITSSVPVTVPSKNLNLSNAVTNNTNLLFGILNTSLYYQYINGTYDNFTLTPNISAIVAVFNTYGLNFTDNLLTAPIEYAPGYTLKIPTKYSNYTYPIIASIFTYNESSVAAAEKFYSYEISPQRTAGAKLTLPIHNQTIYYAANFSTVTKLGVPGYTYKSQLSEYPYQSGIAGVNATVIDSKPLYNTTDDYIIVSQYGHYVLIFEFFGVLNKFNQSTGNSIVQHYYSVLLGK